jgi:hypothetical protein
MKEATNEQNQHRPYWKRMHRSVAFWIFLLLMFIAIIYYIMTVNFALAPQKQVVEPSGTSRSR